MPNLGGMAGDPSELVTEPGGPSRVVDADAIERRSKSVEWTPAVDDPPASRGSATGWRIVAGVGAVALTAVDVLWLVIAIKEFRTTEPGVVRSWREPVQLTADILGVLALLGAIGFLTLFAASGRRWEVFITSDRTARVVAGVLGSLILAGAARWVWVTVELADADSERWWLLKLVVSVAGIAAAVATVTYLLVFAFTDRMWRGWRPVLLTFFLFAAAWTLVVLAERFFF